MMDVLRPHQKILPLELTMNAKEAIRSIPDTVWDDCVLNLCSRGVATCNLPFETEVIHRHSFEVSRLAFEVIRDSPDSSVLHIPSDESPAHATGFHFADSRNSMSRYNAHREGFVFSDGRNLKVEGLAEFEPSMQTFFFSLHEIAEQVISAIERKLELPKDWFQQTLGPTSASSQWHVKRYVVETTQDRTGQERTSNEGKEMILLPMHTDPSIISVVVHDAKGINKNAMGLEYHYQRSDHKREWLEVPFHGHAIATIFVGSILSHITGGVVSAVKHRVVTKTKGPDSTKTKNTDYNHSEDEDVSSGTQTFQTENVGIPTDDEKSRMAATLFIRPKGSSLLQVPPCVRIFCAGIRRQKLQIK